MGVGRAAPRRRLGSYQHGDPLLFAQHGHCSQEDAQQHPERGVGPLLVSCRPGETTDAESHSSAQSWEPRELKFSACTLDSHRLKTLWS